MYPLDRLNTPPTDDDHHQLKRQRRQSSIATDELPPTPRSMTAMDESSDEETTELKKDWTLEDDEELLAHVFSLPTTNLKWKLVETQFADRHRAKMCAERWDYIKKQLLNDVRTVTKEEKDTLSL